MAAPDPVDTAFDKFLTTVGERSVRDLQRRRVEEGIIRQKDLQLVPMRKLLKRLLDLNLVVSNASLHTGGVLPTNTAPVAFQVNEGASSPLWQPGNSLFLDHPAELEISIPNDKDVPEHGVVVIRCSTDHPDSHLLKGPFRHMSEACEAVAEFIARNTEHMNSAHATP